MPKSPSRISYVIDPPEARITMEDLSFFDKLGATFENNMTNFFTWWGTLAARYPLPVIVLSIAFAVGLSSGVIYLQVTTDPIELWASPTSRSRVEKDFFDSTFRPFYRTAQVYQPGILISWASYHGLVSARSSSMRKKCQSRGLKGSPSLNQIEIR